MNRREVIKQSCALTAALGLNMRITHAGGQESPTLLGPLPKNAAARLVWGVERQQYVADEFILRGHADVLESVSMADAVDTATRDHIADQVRRTFEVKTVNPSRPYATRLVVYRPADPARFSGNVIMETTHPLGGGSNLVWRDINAFWMDRGDAYIGVQHPTTLPALAAADAGRYGALQAEHPTQLWAMLADTGRLARSTGGSALLAGARPRHLYMTGYSFTGVATSTFANYHHDRARTREGRPVFDGYVPMANAMYVRDLDVPVIRINTQSDFNSFHGTQNRKPDNDAASGRYRHYEVAGASHVWAPWPQANGATPPAGPPMPAPPGQPRLDAAACMAKFPAGYQPNDFPLHLVMQRTFAALYAWVDGGTRPPRVPLLEVDTQGNCRLDSFGNALGGLRLPQVSVPIATYGVGQGDDCFLFGYRMPFELSRRRELYTTRNNYATQVSNAASQLIDAGLLLADAEHALTEHARGTEEF